MNGPRRMLVLGAVGLTFAGVVMVALWASEPAWVPLYQDLTLSEAGRMIEVLDKAGVRSKLNGDGSEVLVAKDARARARVLLAKEQLPMSGRPGFELFEQKQDWGMTDFTQRITYQRALEGELARTIGSTQGVERAEVHLTIPETGALRRLDRPAKAAVLLKMRPGMMLASGAVQGIIATVSNSVDRLSPENIAVTDETGRLLSGATEDNTLAGTSSKRMEMQRSIEDYLGGKVSQLLGSVAGLGRPRVEVSAQLNFDQVERSIETFDPDGQVLQSEGRSETDAGADPNAGGGQTIINNTYQNSRKFEKIVSAGGGITRLTAAVMVDDRALESDTLSKTPKAERLAAVEQLVKNAIGYDSTRGDRITVTAVALEAPPTIDTTRNAAPARDVIGSAERLIRPGMGLIAIVVMLLLAFRALKNLQPVGRAMPNGAGAVKAELAAPRDEPEVPPLGPPPEAVLLRNRVVEESGERPELMAQVVRAWMAEGS
jgi:flagellar M-ring protein FliF